MNVRYKHVTATTPSMKENNMTIVPESIVGKLRSNRI